MNKYTFVCCCNNNAELESMLLSSLRNIEHEGNIILIDTKEKGYHSAAEAYNKELVLNKDEIADVIIFLHQDIAFLDKQVLDHIVDIINHENNAIVGLAGVVDNKCCTNLQYKSNGEYIVPSALISKVEKVQTLDECLFCMSKDTYFSVMFDEKVCDHWHLYAADICLTATKKISSPIYVLPDIVYHKFAKGGLTVDKQFLKTMWRLCRKHKDIKQICTTCCCTFNTIPSVAYTLMKFYIANVFSNLHLYK